MTETPTDDIMRQMVANVLRNFHRHSPHPEADPEDIVQATAAIMRIPYDEILTRRESSSLYRVEPHDVLYDMREYLRLSPPEGRDDALYTRVVRALYAERSRPARDDSAPRTTTPAPDARPPRPADIGIVGPVDGMNERNPEGSYFRLVAIFGDDERHEFLLSRGSAEALRDHLIGALQS